jgi:long-chain acyl-CoA synthetase
MAILAAGAITDPTLDRFWLKSYPPGVPAEIDDSSYASLVDLIDQSIGRNRDRAAFSCMGQTLGYAEFDRMAQSLAAWLQARGIKPGARVAIMMPNVLQYPVAMLAILRAGCVVVNVNPLYTARELEHQLVDAGAEAVIILENFCHVLAEVLERTPVRHVVVASLGELLGLKGTLVNFVVRHVKKMVPAWHLPQARRFADVLAEGARLTLTPVAVRADDLAFLQYTGGTTGVSKGAALSHRNLIANTLQTEAWSRPGLERPPAIENGVMVCALPLYHIYALTACFLFGVQTNAMVLLIVNPRDVKAVLKDLSKVRFTVFPAVNTLYNAILHHADFGTVDWSSLRVANAGGMAVQQSVAERWFAATGCPIIEGYGLSETSPVATCNPSDATSFSGTVGLPLPSTDVSIRDDAGVDVPLGERGEICIRGPQVMTGYWNRPDETARVMSADGYFKTGDIGIMNAAGYVKIVDRKKDMILVSGFNVYPNEVEDVVAMHPGVLEVAAVGVPDEHSGEVVKIFVVRKDPSLTAEALIAFCRGQLTGYKTPRHVEFRHDLPKSNVGKILRRELRDAKPV